MPPSRSAAVILTPVSDTVCCAIRALRTRFPNWNTIRSIVLAEETVSSRVNRVTSSGSSGSTWSTVDERYAGGVVHARPRITAIVAASSSRITQNRRFSTAM